MAGNFDGMVIAALPGEGDPGYTGLAGTVPLLPPQRLAILGYDDADIDPRERHLLGAPLSHADGKQVAADPLGAATAARQHVEASAAAATCSAATSTGSPQPPRTGARPVTEQRRHGGQNSTQGAVTAQPLPHGGAHGA